MRLGNLVLTAIRLLVVLMAFFHVTPSYAVLASPEPAEVQQPDGKKIKIKLRGDEHFHWNETEEGYAVIKDKADGYWKYAVPSKEKSGFSIVPNARVGSSDPEKLGLKPKATPPVEVLKAAKASRDGKTTGTSPAKTSQPSKSSQTQDDSETLLSPGGAPNPIPISGTKTIKNVVILAAFNDHWDGTAGTVLASKGRTATSEYNNLFNQVGHTNDTAVGSVRDYYAEVSYNKLTIDSIISPWVLLPSTEATYGANNAGGSDVNPRQMVLDAVNAANAAGFDFSQADSDNDGWIDCLTIIHSGHGEEVSGNPTNSIWSHQWTMADVVTLDGKSMYTYHTSPALRGSTASTSIIRIGVICHEMGHFFGLPDLYDYSGTTNGLGNWCIMASGSWNGGDGKQPAHFSAWCKYMLGLLQPKDVESKASISLPRVEDNAEAHLIRTGTSNGEYFLLENRARVGFDNNAAIHPGILIYHIDSKSTNNDLSTYPHPAVKIEEADGDNSLGARTSASEAGDVWTDANGLAGGFRDQSGNVSTNAMMYQGTHAYNRSDSSASYSYIQLSGFSAAGSPMTYAAKTLKAQIDEQAGLGHDYSVSWHPATNATVYELQEGSEQTATSFTDGAESQEGMYENWHIGGNPDQSTTGEGAVPRTGTAAYAFHYYYGSKYYASIQTLTMKKPFVLDALTNISFYSYSRCGVYNGSPAGSLRMELSKDGGGSWVTVGTYTGTHAWTSRTADMITLTGLGFAAGDSCIMRFVVNYELGYGNSSWPGYGFAVDDISVTNTSIATLGNWTTLADNINTTSYPISSKPNGNYAYRVRAFANSTWQPYGSAGVFQVVPVTLSGFEIE